MLGNKKPFLLLQIWHNSFCYFPYLMSFLFCLHVLKNRTCFFWIQCFHLVFHCPVFQHFKDSILLSSVLNFSGQNPCFMFCLIIYFFFLFVSLIVFFIHFQKFYPAVPSFHFLSVPFTWVFVNFLVSACLELLSTFK